MTPRNQYGWGEPVTTENPITIEDAPVFPEFEKCLPGELKILQGSTAELECKVSDLSLLKALIQSRGCEGVEHHF